MRNRPKRGSPFSELAVQATSELLPLEPQVRVAGVGRTYTEANVALTMVQHLDQPAAGANRTRGPSKAGGVGARASERGLFRPRTQLPSCSSKSLCVTRKRDVNITARSQDLQYATILSEAVYARSDAATHEAVAALGAALGVESPLTDVSLHTTAVGQR